MEDVVRQHDWFKMLRAELRPLAAQAAALRAAYYEAFAKSNEIVKRGASRSEVIRCRIAANEAMVASCGAESAWLLAFGSALDAKDQLEAGLKAWHQRLVRTGKHPQALTPYASNILEGDEYTRSTAILDKFAACAAIDIRNLQAADVQTGP